ncbi:hypothetical protein [Bradymonas sediminis]|uniref:hypothetical protein n=1 Tax=Bradymonas sediminis TaxID=1548548 RepID=UPI0010EB440C|nr:hypothetical protein [Bradymonas sediminis]TDP73523.1 condensin subunit MukF [Bradymonas sediminis]
MHEQTDLHLVLGKLSRASVGLVIEPAHLCYLVALRVRAEHGNFASLTGEQLTDLYLQVCELIEPDASNPSKRATHAIQHLRDQRLLRRVDGAGVVRDGEFTLTQLAVAVVDFFVADETLTRVSLVVLMRALISQLGTVLVDARKAQDEQAWRADVVEPLRVTVGDLVAGIERRQRGMDAQQREVREEISALLLRDWFAAVEECEALLEKTSETLSELNEILLRDSALLHEQLQDIEQLAMDAEVEAAVEQAQRVQEHLERVAAWGGERQRAWSDYYQYIQRFLRGVVRLDPDRAVSQRLRDQLAGWLELERRFAFVVADEPSIRLFREARSRVERAPVTRPTADRERAVVLVSEDLLPMRLEERVDEALASGCESLVEVTQRVLHEMPATQRYRFAGRIAALVAERVQVRAPHEREWCRLESAPMEIEEWAWRSDFGGES